MYHHTGRKTLGIRLRWDHQDRLKILIHSHGILLGPDGQKKKTTPIKWPPLEKWIVAA